MSITWRPVNRHLWTPDNGLLFGYADPYDARKTPDRQPDTMILKADGEYKCAVGPDWNQEFVAECHDADSAMYACLMAYSEKTYKPIRKPARPA